MKQICIDSPGINFINPNDYRSRYPNDSGTTVEHHHHYYYGESPDSGGAEILRLGVEIGKLLFDD